MNNLVTFQYSLNILKQYMYITTSTEKMIRYSVTMRTIQYGLVNSAIWGRYHVPQNVFLVDNANLQLVFNLM